MGTEHPLLGTEPAEPEDLAGTEHSLLGTTWGQSPQSQKIFQGQSIIFFSKKQYTSHMFNFDLNRDWVIICPPKPIPVKKCIDDLAGYLGKLMGDKKPLLADPFNPPSADCEIILNMDDHGNEECGFQWRMGNGRVEIYGKSFKGLSNGVYDFLTALGISWPSIGKEILPPPSSMIVLSANKGSDSGRRFYFPVQKNEVKKIAEKPEEFFIWAVRQQFDSIVFPFSAFSSYFNKKGIISKLTDIASLYNISVEAGGSEISSLLPRRYYFFNRGFFRMEDGRRRMHHHLCSTNPEALKLLVKNAKRIFSKIKGVRVFYLQPDIGKENAWCSCPSCRAFSLQEQFCIIANSAADALAATHPGACLRIQEPEKKEQIPLRSNIIKTERFSD